VHFIVETIGAKIFLIDLMQYAFFAFKSKRFAILAIVKIGQWLEPFTAACIFNSIDFD